MNNILKKPYEISLWDDVLTFVDINGNKSEGEITSNLSTIAAQYYQEKKLCIIGSNTMSAPIRAVKPKLESKISGENTLTFTVYSHYWDEDAQKLQWNPFMMYLTNERKVKLKYDGDWYDFVIKNISEDSSSKAFTYTCKDLFVNELSKTGFELEFDNELGNNMGNLPTLAERILEGSDWQLKPNSTETVKQYVEEPLYEITLSSGKTFTVLYGPNRYNYTINAKKDDKIYVFYSSFEYRKDGDEKEETLKILANPQFLYDPKQLYTPDDKNVIIGYDKDEPNGALNCTCEAISDAFSFCDNRRGERLKKTQKTYFDPKLKRTVNVYDDGKVYGYKTTEYVSPITVQSYVTNPSDFTSTTGWNKGKASNETEFPGLEIEVYPELTADNFENYNGHSYLKFSPKANGQVLMNSGLNNNRTTIGSFTKGEKYIFSLEAYSKLSSMSSATNYNIIIAEYDFENSKYSYNKKEDHYLFEKNEDDGYYYCKYSIPEKDYKTAKIGIFIQSTNTGPIYIKEMQFYPYKTVEDGKTVVKPGDTINAVVKEQWCYYDKGANYTGEDDLKYLHKGEASSEYKPYYGPESKPEEAYEKVRSITAKESNRFNLLQSLCELFENWVEFEIDHESDGQISLDENYRQKKWVAYKKYIGQDNHVGFKYGINLKSIKRTLDSNGAISKIIVKNNANEFAPNGFCSISRAEENVTGENTIYNFDYYVGQGLINFSTLNNDLYFQPNNPQGYLGYCKSLKTLNEEAQKETEKLAKLIVDISKYDSQYQTYKMSADAAEEDKTKKEDEFYTLTGVSFSKAIPEYQEYKPELHSFIFYDKNKHTDTTVWNYYYLDNGWVLTNSPTDKTQYVRKKTWPNDRDQIWGYYDKNKNKLTRPPDPKEGDLARLTWWDNSEAKKIYQAIARDVVVARDHGVIAKRQKILQDAAKLQQTAIEARLKKIREAKLEINKRFYQKYSRFIQEGSWISEDYIDDNLYYLDALSTLYTSSRPKVTYTIDVLELSQLPGYELFEFALGDKTYVEDKEFFGWAYDGSKRLYREEVIVTEIAWELDSPESNKIKVQNYKTQFEDLFQRVVATTQQVQFSTGEYKRSAAIVEPGGTINVTTLQNSFTNNALTLQNVKDQSVIIGDDGITTTNLSRPSEIVRITSGGIFLSSNGGETWTAGITANGINASCITSGQLNVSEVNLTMGSETAFRWDKLGISAYKRDESGISPGIFTRFDQFGIYGVNGDRDFDALKDVAGREGALEKIKENSSFGLTWDGFWLKSNGTNGYVSISSDRDFEVIRIVDKTEECLDGKIPIIQIGRWKAGLVEHYGFRINDTNGSPVLEATEEGELWLKKILSIQTDDKEYEEDKETSKSHTVQIGSLGREDTATGVNIYKKANKVFDANGQFKIYEDGHIEGTDAHFTGSNVFEGTITATGGTIGGLSIDAWKEMTFSVRIESTNGIILKDEDSTILTAELYHGNTKLEITEVEWETEEGGSEVKYYTIVNSGAKDEVRYEVQYQWYKYNNETMTDEALGGEFSPSYTVELGDQSVQKITCTITLTEV